MNRECDKIKGLIADSVTGILSPDLARQLDEHLSGCSDCRSYADALRYEDVLLTQLVAGLDTDMTNRQQRLLETLDRCQSEQRETIAKWRIIMKSRIMKLAAVAVIVIAVLLGVDFVGRPNMANVAWAKVTRRASEVDYVHMYYFKSRGNDFARHFEAWYAHGKMVMRGNKGDAHYDDGRMSQGFDEHGMLTVREPSKFAAGQPVLELFTGGLLSAKNEQFNQQVPASVGDDFLIYAFDPSPRESDWMRGIFITVGKNSLLPVQVKVCHKDSDYDLIIFDYEAPKEPSEFFEPPDVGEPNARCEVLLDGEEAMVPVTGAPGLKTAIVRLRSGPSGDTDKASFYLDVTFITDEGYRSGTNERIGLKVDEARQCGTGSAEGGLDKWPDGKYRNIRFSPWLRPAGKENTYIVEIRCRLETQED